MAHGPSGGLGDLFFFARHVLQGPKRQVKPVHRGRPAPVIELPGTETRPETHLGAWKLGRGAVFHPEEAALPLTSGDVVLAAMHVSYAKGACPAFHATTFGSAGPIPPGHAARRGIYATSLGLSLPVQLHPTILRGLPLKNAGFPSARPRKQAVDATPQWI